MHALERSFPRLTSFSEGLRASSHNLMRYAVATGMYSALPYAVAQGTVEMPYIFVQCLFFSVITYFLYHLQVDAGEPGASALTAARYLGKLESRSGYSGMRGKMCLMF